MTKKQKPLAETPLFSDIDNTLVFSEQKIMKIYGYGDEESMFVETYNLGRYGVMNKKARILLEDLAEANAFIPTTARSYEQYKRLDFPETKYIICDNGASIYINGKKDKRYTKLLKQKVKLTQRISIEKAVEGLIPLFKNNLRLNPIKYSDTGFSVMFKLSGLSKDDLQYLSQAVRKFMNDNSDYDDFDYAFSNQKFYLFREIVHKKAAINYIFDKEGRSSYYNRDYFAAGDSAIDVTMLARATRAFIPNRSELQEILNTQDDSYDGVYLRKYLAPVYTGTQPSWFDCISPEITKEDGLIASREILESVAKQIACEQAENALQ